jgi:arylsulfatase A-like enzyme
VVSSSLCPLATCHQQCDTGTPPPLRHKEGGNIIQTPYLESLANSGTKLQNYYIYRFCSPSRSTFMVTVLPRRTC